MRPIILYHDHCPDGFGAAFAFWLKYQDDAEYYPVSHNQQPFRGYDLSLFKDREIIMIDVAFNRDEMIKIKSISKSFKLLDHHASAFSDLSDLDFCYFDMNHSGAALAWLYCFPDKEMPLLIKYIETRDIHTWNLPYANEILSVIDSYDKNFKLWNHLYEQLETTTGFAKMVQDGEPILKYLNTLKDKIKKSAYKINICGYEVPAINTPIFKSEILNELAVGNPFSAGYDYNGIDYVFSLRADKNGINVIDIAKKFGGGGHPKAAGFRLKSLELLNKEE